MTRISARLSLLAALVLGPFVFAQAGTVHGTVKNGTSGKPKRSSTETGMCASNR